MGRRYGQSLYTNIRNNTLEKMDRGASNVQNTRTSASPASDDVSDPRDSTDAAVLRNICSTTCTVKSLADKLLCTCPLRSVNQRRLHILLFMTSRSAEACSKESIKHRRLHTFVVAATEHISNNPTSCEGKRNEMLRSPQSTRIGKLHILRSFPQAFR
jgi:hypothetical protein